eukprot:CAMPEP_0203715026 /NCGR_PEP_ID=MMETSP0091-20130426/71386_1 /ASSEMBLY_ACC=CAM_ASM_001089 /TAXON_ID=426623 /ORGANISM="Chaetoceros affinis, Strain CCMP159" /LENGTH=105 /DNA_ID=CAMNT_0050593111 /DNA_START=1 /DNA_END=318 /DNA_ORIENTATION=+
MTISPLIVGFTIGLIMSHFFGDDEGEDGDEDGDTNNVLDGYILHERDSRSTSRDDKHSRSRSRNHIRERIDDNHDEDGYREMMKIEMEEKRRIFKSRRQKLLPPE